MANVAGALSDIRDSFAKAVRDASYDNIAKVMSDAVQDAKTAVPCAILCDARF